MTAYCAPLPHKSLYFSGSDSLTFLQGQLTQDITRITEDSCHYGAYCDHKGRMLANVLINKDKNGYTLRFHEAIFDAISKRLKLFLLRAAVTVETTPLQYFGLNTEAATQLCEQLGIALPDSFASYQETGLILNVLPGGNVELALSPQHPLCDTFTNGSNDSDDIMALRLMSGHFDILPETSEQFFPQQTVLAAWGAINYQKGCYIGQEVIARSRYKGKVNKAMGVAVIEHPLAIAPLEKIRAGDRPVGQVVQSHQSPRQTVCLAILSEQGFEQAASIGDHQAHFTRLG